MKGSCCYTGKHQGHINIISFSSRQGILSYSASVQNEVHSIAVLRIEIESYTTYRTPTDASPIQLLTVRRSYISSLLRFTDQTLAYQCLYCQNTCYSLRPCSRIANAWSCLLSSPEAPPVVLPRLPSSSQPSASTCLPLLWKVVPHSHLHFLSNYF